MVWDIVQHATATAATTELIGIGEPPKTAFRTQVDGGRSVFGVAGLMAAPSICVFLPFDPLWLMGFRLFLVLICAFQTSFRGRSFKRTICS
jgi:hypothetical protein